MLRNSVEATLLVLMVVVVAGPILAERFGLPGIIGLITGGVVVGPFVLDWVVAGGLADDLGSIGILYLMFLAGVSFDLRAFMENRGSALTYGLLGFVLPFGLSVGVVLSVADPGLLGAALIGAMWASNTLVAYPEVQAAGLQSNRAVTTAVSAGCRFSPVGAGGGGGGPPRIRRSMWRPRVERGPVRQSTDRGFRTARSPGPPVGLPSARRPEDNAAHPRPHPRQPSSELVDRDSAREA